jgi:hypothetical protein
MAYHLIMNGLLSLAKSQRRYKAFALKVDKVLQQKNIYYFDLIEGNILQPLIVQSLKKDTFINYMRSPGKLGGQNKVPTTI